MDDEKNDDELDAFAGTPLGKVLEMTRKQEAREGEARRTEIGALRKLLGVSDDGKGHEDTADQPKRVSQTRDEMARALKEAARTPEGRAALEKSEEIVERHKGRAGGPGRPKGDAGPLEPLAEVFEKAGCNGLARMFRRPKK